jgi:hypothetical protein
LRGNSEVSRSQLARWRHLHVAHPHVAGDATMHVVANKID